MAAEVGNSEQRKPEANPWLIAATVALAAFMEVLDTSIANVALPHIAGDLGASTSQGTWVLTSYLVSNAIILPVGAWASSVIGRKNFFMLCITIFTVASFLCGIAPTLPILLLARFLQGVGGGGLQPMAQAIIGSLAGAFIERHPSESGSNTSVPTRPAGLTCCSGSLDLGSAAVNKKFNASDIAAVV